MSTLEIDGFSVQIPTAIRTPRARVVGGSASALVAGAAAEVLDVHQPRQYCVNKTLFDTI